MENGIWKKSLRQEEDENILVGTRREARSCMDITYGQLGRKRRGYELAKQLIADNVLEFVVYDYICLIVIDKFG